MSKHLAYPVLIALTFILGGCGGGGSGDGEPGDPCNGTIDCTPGSICYHEVCVTDGALRFSLAWDKNVDLDLHVETPEGSHIYYSNSTADGGELDVDDCVAGACENPDGTHVENVFFDSSASAGTYTFWADYFSGSESADYELEVAVDGGVERTLNGTLASSGDESEHHTFEF